MLHKGRWVTLFSVLLIAAVIIFSVFCIEKPNYYLLSAFVLLFSIFPFYASLETKKLKARELVTIASMVAIAVSGRAAFYAVPQVKPMCAIVIITAITFGAKIGFVTGTLAMLLSNFIFGQGLWTPFQMFGMGMCGLICGLIFYGKQKKPTLLVALLGGLVCFAVYGLIVDLSSVFMMSADYSLGSVLSIYASGVPFNAIHGASTFIFLFIIEPVFTKILKRIKTKFDLFGGVQ